MLILLLAGCSQDLLGLTKPPEPSGPVEEAEAGEPAGDDTAIAPPPPAEECNGVDDNGDGAVDEGFPDADGNGRADCLDGECPALRLPSAGEVPIQAECAASLAPVADPWRVRQLWAVSTPLGYPEWHEVPVAPIVAHLDDDDGDGRIGVGDTPEVVVNFGFEFVTRGKNRSSCGVAEFARLVVFDAATGAERWSVGDIACLAQPMVADVDADGAPEVVVLNRDRRLAAFDAAGNLETVGGYEAGDSNVTLSVVDVDADGVPEVLADGAVYDGATLGVEVSFYDPADFQSPLVTAADLDQDGVSELLYGYGTWAPDRTEIDDYVPLEPGRAWPVVVRADADEAPEVAWIGGHYDLLDDDGWPLVRALDEPGTYSTAPCAGDLDGDGATELAFGHAHDLMGVELDGTVLWYAESESISDVMACAVFDLDGDGAQEVLWSDDAGFRVLDGATGEVRVDFGGHRGATWYAGPTVADVDGDGHAEVILPGNNEVDGYALRVLTHDGAGWPEAPDHWNAADWRPGMVHADGHIPRVLAPSWSTTGIWRGQLAGAPAGVDLAPSIPDLCVADCAYGPVVVGLQVTNEGEAPSPAGVMARLYAEDHAGRRLLGTWSLPAIPGGRRGDGWQAELVVDDVPEVAWVLTVDEEQDVEECDEADNEARLAEGVCS